MSSIPGANSAPGRSGATVRRRYNIADSAPVVGMLGRLRPWKGQERFLRTANKVSQAIPQARFLVIGGTPLGDAGTYPEELKALVDDLVLTDRAILTGQIDDVPAALAALDLFVHPGDPEPFGLVNIEAMAMELPVVAFNHGALPEIVADGKSGVLVTPGDLEALSETITGLLQDPDRMKSMGHAGRKIVEDRFTIEDTAHGVETVLDEVLGIS